MAHVLQIGSFAYIDSFTGLVPCKVQEIGRDSNGSALATVRVTAARRGYNRGEIVTLRAVRVIPRGAVYIRSHQYRIRPFEIIA